LQTLNMLLQLLQQPCVSYDLMQVQLYKLQFYLTRNIYVLAWTAPVIIVN